MPECLAASLGLWVEGAGGEGERVGNYLAWKLFRNRATLFIDPLICLGNLLLAPKDLQHYISRFSNRCL